MNYYNEFDQGAAEWLRRLIARGLLPAGDVDQRDIREVRPEELRKYVQCHFFAGIGGWSLALRLAGWDEARPVWTGSCPCQPFSVAGKRKGEQDERHLWPEFKRLIEGAHPPVVFGEQVASKDGVEWLAGVRADLEGCGYEVGGADLPAAGISAPHIRQRLWWVADATKPLLRQVAPAGDECGDGSDNRASGRMEDAGRELEGRGILGSAEVPRQGSLWPSDKSGGSGGSLRLVDAIEPGLEGHAGDGDDGRQPGRVHQESNGSASEASRARYWDAFDIVHCADGKARRIEPGTFPLAHGVPGRMVKLRAYGNAIVPELAAEFVMAYKEVRGS